MSTKNNPNNLKNYLIILAITAGIISAGLFYIQSKVGNSDFKKLVTTATTLNVDFPSSYNKPLLLEMADLAISILPLGAQSAKAQVTGNIVKYIDAYQNTDVVQTKSSNKLKEDIILKSAGHPAIFEYQIDMTQFDVSKDDEGNLYFFRKGHQNDINYQLFTIPAPFMVDAGGKKSSTKDVEAMFHGADRLVLKPSAKWLAKAKYPVVLDPTIEITILNVHSHPQQGDNWTVDFTTQGTADLKIIPTDQATIDDDEFVSLKCDGQNLRPQILAGDVIFYPNWNCSGVGQVVHYTKKAGNHTLKFDFGGQISYAYNNYTHSISATGGTITYTDSDGLNPRSSPAYSGGYTVHTFTTAFADTETTPKIVTASGDAQRSTAQSKFGGASALFDGAGDYLSVPDSADWDFNGDFTIDGWIRWSNGFTSGAILGNGWTTGWMLYYIDDGGGTGRFVFYAAGADVCYPSAGAISPVANTWYHIAVVRSGTSLKIYFNGTLEATSVYGTAITSNNALYVGSDITDGSYFKGYLDELRISKGIARWTSDFSASLPTSSYVADANTNLLLHVDSSTFTVTGSGNVDYLVVAGGGGGGHNRAGGGGAGGMLTGTLAVTAGTKTVTVGAGGAGTAVADAKGSEGQNSVFDSITATGGGGGQGGAPSAIGNGGSGGGSIIHSAAISGGTGVAGPPRQGYNGGSTSGNYVPPYKGSGGGGAGEAGHNPINDGGDSEGGDGASSSISGTATYYAGGGGGGGGTTIVSGGLGGGGSGGSSDTGGSTSGTANTGGGGGGEGGGATGVSGSGGSGIVIVRYLTDPIGIPTPIIFRSAYAPATDTYTKLLLHTDGSNGSTTFTDSETTPKTVTASGNATQSTAQSKFGGASALFDGTGDYLSLADSADWNFGTGDYTIDFWAYSTALDGLDAPFAIYQDANNEFWIHHYSGGWDIGCDSGGANIFTLQQGSDTLTYNTWHHYALVRNGTTVTFYQDGTQLLQQTGVSGAVGNYTVAPTIGTYATHYWNGYLDEFRVSKGIARWTSNFTSPASAYSSTAVAGVPIIFRSAYAPATDTYTKLLLHTDGSNGSTTFTDSETTPKTVTASGNAQISTAQSKFGGASGLFDGSGDYITTDSASDFDFGTGNFTIDFWVYRSSSSAAGVFSMTSPTCESWINADAQFAFYCNGYVYKYCIGSVGALSINTWHHIAIVRYGTAENNLAFYFDGVLQTSGTWWDNLAANESMPDVGNFLIGSDGPSAPSGWFNGYIDEFRISKGIARWTTDFTAPTSAYSSTATSGQPIIFK